jgi:hypothetical protein
MSPEDFAVSQYLQVVPTPDKFPHELWEEPSECLCGPAVEYREAGKAPLIMHRPLVEDDRTRWAVVKPGDRVALQED